MSSRPDFQSSVTSLAQFLSYLNYCTKWYQINSCRLEEIILISVDLRITKNQSFFTRKLWKFYFNPGGLKDSQNSIIVDSRIEEITTLWIHDPTFHSSLTIVVSNI